MEQEKRVNEFTNPSYQPHLQTPPNPAYENPGQSLVVAVPPSNTGVGLFLNNDIPILVQPDYNTGGTGPFASLEYLKNVARLHIKQKIEMIEVLTNFDTQNRFTIYNEQGQVVFYALEDSNFCVRQCCGPARPFDLKILDVYQNEVIHITRPLACQSCCCFCCLMNVEVTSPPGNIVGKVQQQCSVLFPKFTVEDALGETVLRIDGPFCTLSCGGDVVFKIMTADGKTQIGDVSKKWAGVMQEWLTDADNFSVSFPQDLDVGVKAILLGAVFLIDVMYFEKAK